MSLEDGSDEEIAFEVESDESEVVVDIEKNLGPDFKYSGQFGYWFYKVLRGDTPGRHLKRDVFFFTVVQIVCSAALLKTMDDASYLLITSKFLHQTVALNNFRALVWVVSIFNLPMALVSLVSVRHWATLCTNRHLLVSYMRLLCILVSISFILALWAVVSLFVGYKNADVHSVALIRSLYTTCAALLCVYLAGAFAAVLDIWAYADDVAVGGVIQEPNGPGPILDLSGLTVQDGALFCVALPLGAIIQVLDAIGAMCRYSTRCIGGGQRSYVVHKTSSSGEVVTTTTARKSTGCCMRCFKTIGRRASQLCSHTITPTNGSNETNDNNESSKDMASPHDQLSHKLAELRRKKDRSSSAADYGAEYDGIDIEFGYNANAGAVEEPIAEPIDTMMVSKGDVAGQEESKVTTDVKTEDALESMSVTQYKALWSSLETAGSFQCKLKEVPSIHRFSEHMRKQGFHVVFASSDAGVSKITTANSSTIAAVTTASAGGGAIGPDQSTSMVSRVDIEIGISNRRANDSEPWFLARFIIANNIFSAVMKCQQIDDVANHVKKFLLAKALRIDTTVSV